MHLIRRRLAGLGALLCLTLLLGAAPPAHGQGTVTIPISMGLRSSGLMYMTWSDTAGTAGTTANLVVMHDSAGKPVTAGALAENAIGIALNTAASGAPVEVAFQGVVDCVADGTVTAGHLLVVGVITNGRCFDAGTTLVGINAGYQVIGYALTSATVGTLVSVYLTVPALRGSIGTEANLLLSDVTTNNTSTTKHGFAPKLSNVSTQYLSGTGVYSVPAGVTSIATTSPITGGTITSTGTLGLGALVNAQTGTTYTVVDGDRGKLVTHTNASAIAVTLPQAGSGGNFLSGWFADVQNRGAGTATITPTTSTIDGAANLALTTAQGVRIFSDGTNYFTQRGIGGGGSGAPTGASYVTLGTDATLTAERVLTGSTALTGPGVLLTDAGAGSTVTVSIPNEQWGIVTSDVTHAQSNTSFVDITGLGCTMGSSATEIWQFEIQGMMQSPTNTDIKFQFSNPSSITSAAWGTHAATPADDYWGPTSGPTVAAQPLLGITTTQIWGTSGSVDGFLMRGFLFASGTPGSVFLQFAQNTAQATNTIIKAGSIMICRRVKA